MLVIYSFFLIYSFKLCFEISENITRKGFSSPADVGRNLGGPRT